MAILPAYTDSESEYIEVLSKNGIRAATLVAESALGELQFNDTLELILIDPDTMSVAEFRECIAGCSRLQIPCIALLSLKKLPISDIYLEADDFLIMPVKTTELVLRARRAMRNISTANETDLIRAGDMLINTANFEVSVNSKRVSLRFKEYELLQLMASNPGRVYSREALLNQIWGYDYLGGTRTVDVHIRRLRKNINVNNTKDLIRTVRSSGYSLDIIK